MLYVPLKDISIFDLNWGDRILDLKSYRYGTLSIKETISECLDIYVLYDNETEETLLNQSDTRYVLVERVSK